jgi:uncharacterized membrane protein
MLVDFNIHLPEDGSANREMVFRWIHFLAGFTWLGMLYFFNLVNVGLMKELDAPTKGKVFPALMSRALWWFRMAAVVTVFFGGAYWGEIVNVDARNAGASGAGVFGSFFLIWTIVWGLMYVLLIPGKGILNKGPVLAVLYAVIILVACWAFLDWNSRGWESNRLLAIGLGGGMGWVMMLNVWGVIWRIQKRLIQWTKENSTNGTPIPDKAKAMARMAFLCSRANAYLSIPLLFLMGAASHYPMFGNLK